MNISSYAHNVRLRHLLEDVSLITRLEDGSSRIDLQESYRKRHFLL